MKTREIFPLASYFKSKQNNFMLDTCSFSKTENLLFTSVFLDNYYLLKNKECPTYAKQRLKSLNFLYKSYRTTVSMATMTFQYGGYFDSKTTSVTRKFYFKK